MARIWTGEDNLQEMMEEVALKSPVYGHQAAVMNLWYDITTAMKAQGVTQTELAERAGLKQSYVSRVLSNTEKISLRTAFRLCNALGLELVVKARPKPAAQRTDGAARPRAAKPQSRTRKTVAAHSA